MYSALLASTYPDDTQLIAIDGKGVPALTDSCTGALLCPESRVAAVRTNDICLTGRLAAPFFTFSHRSASPSKMDVPDRMFVVTLPSVTLCLVNLQIHGVAGQHVANLRPGAGELLDLNDNVQVFSGFVRIRPDTGTANRRSLLRTCDCYRVCPTSPARPGKLTSTLAEIVVRERGLIAITPENPLASRQAG